MNYEKFGATAPVQLTTRNSILYCLLDRELHLPSSFSVFFFLVFNFCFILLHIERMHHMGNAFVACGVVYCIDAYNSRSTTINFAYDFKTGRSWNPNIQFTNQYGYNSMVDYNPSERVLYAWDNKRLVTYPITFEPQK